MKVMIRKFTSAQVHNNHNKKLLKKLSLYTLRGESMMRWQLYEKEPRDKIAVAFVSKTKIAGWALKFKESWSPHKVIYIYVRPEYRRRHIGTKLAKSLKSKERVMGHGWTKQAEKFFKSIGGFKVI